MPATKAPPLMVLENFHSVSEAAIRLGLRKPDEMDKHGKPSKKGEKWLRDGANRPKDGSEGEPFPHTRLAGQLMFSDSHLARIAQINENKPETRGRRRLAPRRSPSRPARSVA